MKRQEILDTIKTLASSQGLYGRLYEQITTAENKDEILTTLEKENFKDALDLVFFFEC